MIISMFITFVTMMRNFWLKIAIILAMAAATFVMFDHFEQNKMTEAVEKFYKVDKLKKRLKRPYQGRRVGRKESIG